MDVVSSRPEAAVTGEVVYLAKTAEKPYTYTYDPPEGVAKTNIVGEPHTVPIYDMRPIRRRADAGRAGFRAGGRADGGDRFL